VQNQGKQRSILPFVIALQLPFLVLAACTQAGSSDKASPASTPDSLQLPTASGQPAPLALPKVPFGNQPCRSLSQDEQKHIEMQAHGYASPVPGKPDRAPHGLPYDNVCAYDSLMVGYMTQVDYDFNRSGNRSSERSPPPDLPGAFYAAQGELWFAKNGYYVTIEGSSSVQVLAAGVIAAKL
jgi:hypothetical protein